MSSLIKDMTREQVVEEKLCIQKALLRFESVHGRPSSRADRDLMRPLYDRYRSVKRLIGGSPFQGAGSGLGSAKEDALQPIIEHVQMDFKSPFPQQPLQQQQQITGSDFEANFANKESSDLCDGPVSSITSDLRDHEPSPPLTPLEKQSCNLHELPLPELLAEQRKTKLEKRRIRRLLRQFEEDFQLATGRKVQREDRTPMEKSYAQYKHIKARLRLMEALVLKNENQVKC
ncbi:protein FAM13A-like [Tropilaelaps mercedesae]|uniref:Protein FAM13A-like n=1 Tax=Tropilaelaps mercedesae TaxID=418985 RepID=A0A1V9XAD2_9ACAR|nr:protein FAM13A-like [Tropilaelaps mercedesae]